MLLDEILAHQGEVRVGFVPGSARSDIAGVTKLDLTAGMGLPHRRGFELAGFEVARYHLDRHAQKLGRLEYALVDNGFQEAIRAGALVNRDGPARQPFHGFGVVLELRCILAHEHLVAVLAVAVHGYGNQPDIGHLVFRGRHQGGHVTHRSDLHLVREQRGHHGWAGQLGLEPHRAARGQMFFPQPLGLDDHAVPSAGPVRVVAVGNFHGLFGAHRRRAAEQQSGHQTARHQLQYRFHNFSSDYRSEFLPRAPFAVDGRSVRRSAACCRHKVLQALPS